MKTKRPLLIAIVLFLIVVALVGQTLFKSGFFKKITNFSNGYEVTEIVTPPGIEDLDIDSETGTVFLSSHDRRNRASNGAIWSMNTDGKLLKNLTEHLNLSQFRPHGISFLNINGSKFLFVISHRDEKDIVLKFRFAKDSLSLENSYSSTDFSSPNDLCATDENAFFITNDHGTVKGWKKTLVDFLRLPVGNVVYFDNGKSTVVLDKITYPNGVLVHNDEVYVSSTIGNYIAAYTPKSANYHLEEVRRISTPHAPDNLMAWGNRIYTAGHPKLLAFTKHVKSSNAKSPSSVYYLQNGEIHEILLNDGTLLSGSSTALPVFDSKGKQTIFVGSVFEQKILKLTEK
jgi:arylesterase/paraoxonase